MPVSSSSTDMSANGAQATLMLHAVSGGSPLVGAPGGWESSSARASAACGSAGGGAAGPGVTGASPAPLAKWNSRLGFQNWRNTAVTTREKMPPPMSVMG